MVVGDTELLGVRGVLTAAVDAEPAREALWRRPR